MVYVYSYMKSDNSITFVSLMIFPVYISGSSSFVSMDNFGPTQYRSRTIIENVTPELIRDFFWDDEFRTEWDDMLFYFKILQECPQTGTMIIHWIRKLCWKYIFLGDREYIINRRIWEYGRTYYCLTKSTPYRSLPRLRKPRGVDLYYSSWPIRAVKSRKGDGQLTASEVLLFHYEDMGIPKELAKIGIGRAMWGLVRKMEAGVQAYQVAQATGASPLRYALMARINTKISADALSTNLKDALKQCRSPVT
ncbi:hypothetical protein AMTR_s00413p00010550 [Amborella trichopoda]|uniref:START domain-containing protein n=1 Tax=Amborella trichopoda TaxID=13333 RepID=W1PHN2_AMBTC|nr:hypothetical protein AMTR_s00413p00010550 [Amborella trichopoda]